MNQSGRAVHAFRLLRNSITKATDHELQKYDNFTRYGHPLAPSRLQVQAGFSGGGSAAINCSMRFSSSALSLNDVSSPPAFVRRRLCIHSASPPPTSASGGSSHSSSVCDFSRGFSSTNSP